MLVIRLFRVGKKNQPFFKIVVTDKRKPPRAGRFVEELGNWNPLKKEKILKGDRIKYWLSCGAKPSPTIFNLLVSEKIIEGKKIPVHKKSKKTEEKPTPPASAEASVPAPAGASADKPADKPADKEEKPTPEVKKEEALEPEEPKKPAEEKIEEVPKEEKKEEVVKKSPKEEAKPEEVK